MGTTLIDPARLAAASATGARLLAQLDRILLGQEALHRLVLTGILSRGHILLEGLPGLGKTALIKALGAILQLTFKRVQFTPDLMPGDILGSHILQEDASGQRDMVFRPGPVFTNLLLADEINRASPKTQSALLETMQEQSVTLLGTTRSLPRPFVVLASQNPIELEGTYPLPEAQLDRFLFRLLVQPPPAAVLSAIVHERRRGEAPAPTWTLSAAELDELFAVMDGIFLSRALADYIARLVEASHPEAAAAPAVVRDYVTYGASPRAGLALAEAARAQALLAGRPTAGFEDVQAVAEAVLNHRLILNYRARLDRVDSRQVVAGLLSAVRPVDLDLPGEVRLEEPRP